MSKAAIENILKTYFENFDPNKLKFSLLEGKIELNNLYFKRSAINDILDKANLPFQLKFGMITKLNVDVSILGLVLEIVEIEDLIVVLSSNLTNASNFEKKVLDKLEFKEALLKHMLQNSSLQKEGKPMNPLSSVSAIPEAVRTSLDGKEKALMSVPVRNPAPPVAESTAGTSNILGPELYGIITGRMEFNVVVKNIKVYYEDCETVTDDKGQVLNFSGCLNVSEFRFKSNDIQEFLDGQGNFKNLLNVKNLLSTCAQGTSLIYLSNFLAKMSFEIYFGKTQVLPKNIDEEIRTKEPAYFVDYFHKLNAKRGDYFDCLLLDNLSVDIILGIDQGDTSEMPLQALLFYVNLKDLKLNLQISVLSELALILGNISAISSLSKVSEVRPLLKVMSRNEMDGWANKLSLDLGQKKQLKEINRELIQESLRLPIWRSVHSKFSALEGIDVNKRLGFSYRRSSLIYRLIFGRTGKQVEEDYAAYVKYELEEIKRKEIEAENERKRQNAQQATPTVDEDLRTKIDKHLVKITKATGKFHIQIRLHSNVEIDLLNENFKREFTFFIKGIDFNVVKPRGRFQASIGLMIRTVQMKFNLPAPAKKERGIFESDVKVDKHELERSKLGRPGSITPASTIGRYSSISI